MKELLAAACEHTAGSRTIAASLAGILAWRGEPAEMVRPLLDHALDGNRLLPQVDSDPLIVVHALFAAVFLDELAQAELLAHQLLAFSRSRGSVTALGVAAFLRAAVRARRGQLVGAETDVRTVMDIATEHGAAFAVPSVLYSEWMR